jgi:hypothetical protein
MKVSAFFLSLVHRTTARQDKGVSMTDGLLVGWKLASLRPDVASVRYRAMIPVIGLEKRGVRARVFSVASTQKLDGLDCLVVVKGLTRDDLDLVREAVNRRIPVVIDLCDNIFVDEYGKTVEKKTAAPLTYFDQMAKLASLIVATTDSLAEIVRQRIGQAVEVAVIPDGIEDKHLLEAIVNKLRTAALAEREGFFGEAKRRIASILPNRLQQICRASINENCVSAVDTRSLLSNPDAKRIVWFGFHGAPHARFGMLDLLLIKEELEAIAAEFQIELVVVSNNRDKYEKHICALGIPSRYVEWSSAALTAELETASVAVIPNSLDAFSVCKSANRAVLSLLNSVPVVATRTPALNDLEGCVIFDDFKSGIREYFLNKEKAISDVKNARRRIDALFGADVVSGKWVEALESASKKERHRTRDERVAAPWSRETQQH